MFPKTNFIFLKKFKLQTPKSHQNQNNLDLDLKNLFSTKHIYFGRAFITRHGGRQRVDVRYGLILFPKKSKECRASLLVKGISKNHPSLQSSKTTSLNHLK